MTGIGNTELKQIFEIVKERQDRKPTYELVQPMVPHGEIFPATKNLIISGFTGRYTPFTPENLAYSGERSPLFIMSDKGIFISPYEKNEKAQAITQSLPQMDWHDMVVADYLIKQHKLRSETIFKYLGGKTMPDPAEFNAVQTEPQMVYGPFDSDGLTPLLLKHGNLPAPIIADDELLTLLQDIDLDTGVLKQHDSSRIEDFLSQNSVILIADPTSQEATDIRMLNITYNRISNEWDGLRIYSSTYGSPSEVGNWSGAASDEAINCILGLSQGFSKLGYHPLSAMMFEALVSLPEEQMNGWMVMYHCGGSSEQLTQVRIQTQNNYGFELLCLGNVDEAVEVLSGALEEHSDLRGYPIHNNLATAFHMKLDYDKAREHYIKELELNPDHPTAKKSLNQVERLQQLVD